MRKKHKVIFKYLLLISVLMLMLPLCACRTRLTNNTEVTATITDEDGWLAESYEMRREDLGSPVAERPIFKGWGSDDEDDYYDDSGDLDGLEDYDPNDQVWDEPDDTPVSTPPTSTPSTPTTPTTRPSQPTSPTNTNMITITLELNDGHGTRYTKSFTKGTSYEALPKGTWEGHTFIEWTTDKENKKPVKPKDKMTVNQTLYAHWKDAKEDDNKKGSYKIKWEYDSDVTVSDADNLPAKIKKGGKYPDPLPAAHKKNYHFLGWDDGSGLITAGQKCTGDSTLVAKFDSWEKIYNDAVPPEDQEAAFVAENGTDELVRGVDWNSLESPESGPDYVIIAISGDFTEEDAKAAADSARNTEVDGSQIYQDSVIIVVPKNASNSKNELYYKLLLHTLMYGDLDGFDKAADDTEAAATDFYIDDPLSQTAD